jgi:FAS-associated factor 2
LPNGEHRERRFHSSATVQTIYDFVDSIVCFDVLAYNLVSNFPLIVYTPSTHNCTLKDIALHPHASLFVQVDDDDAAAPTAADDDDNDDS